MYKTAIAACSAVLLSASLGAAQAQDANKQAKIPAEMTGFWTEAGPDAKEAACDKGSVVAINESGDLAFFDKADAGWTINPNKFGRLMVEKRQKGHAAHLVFTEIEDISGNKNTGYRIGKMRFVEYVGPLQEIDKKKRPLTLIMDDVQRNNYMLTDRRINYTNFDEKTFIMMQCPDGTAERIATNLVFN